MTRDDIIRMAREAKLPLSAIGSSVYKWEDLERFAALVAETERKYNIQMQDILIDAAVKTEREACAKECDDAVNSISETADAQVREVATNVCINLGRYIRARGTT
jgi:hypothetical protein